MSKIEIEEDKTVDLKELESRLNALETKTDTIQNVLTAEIESTNKIVATLDKFFDKVSKMGDWKK